MGVLDRGARPTGLEVGEGADSAGRRLWPRSWGCHGGCGGKARQEVEEKKNSGLAPGESGTDSDWKGEKGEREKKKLGQERNPVRVLGALGQAEESE